jgi:glutathione-regulated potassium-efflux system protein KefB
MTGLEVTILLLVVAVVAVPLAKRMGLGSILGYVAAGAVIGPSGAGLIENVESIGQLAEFGVVFLLFIIGLELQPSRLWTMRKSIFGLGSIQFLATAIVLTGLGLLAGLTLGLAVLIAGALPFRQRRLPSNYLARKNYWSRAPAGRPFPSCCFRTWPSFPYWPPYHYCRLPI